MKKITTLFLVLVLVFSFVSCATTSSEETATTTEIHTLNHDAQVDEIVQWATVNIINKTSVQRYEKAQLYEDVKKEIESYISSLPTVLAPTKFSIKLISSDLFEIKIIF